VPPPQVPLARFAPQPAQVRETVRLPVEQLSAQEPAEVTQPDPTLHEAVQHWLLPPTAQPVLPAEHEQPPQLPPPSQWRAQVAG
jgi:hypothetical protein